MFPLDDAGQLGAWHLHSKMIYNLEDKESRGENPRTNHEARLLAHAQSEQENSCVQALPCVCVCVCVHSVVKTISTMVHKDYEFPSLS